MSEPHELLSKAMHARRLELDMSWRALAEEAGVSPEALRAIRRGEYRPAELTARRLDDALRWEHGSTYRTLDGGSPTPIGTSPPAEEPDSRPLLADPGWEGALAVLERSMEAFVTARQQEIAAELAARLDAELAQQRAERDELRTKVAGLEEELRSLRDHKGT